MPPSEHYSSGRAPSGYRPNQGVYERSSAIEGGLLILVLLYRRFGQLISHPRQHLCSVAPQAHHGITPGELAARELDQNLIVLIPLRENNMNVTRVNILYLTKNSAAACANVHLPEGDSRVISVA